MSYAKYYYFCGVRIGRSEFIKEIFGKDMPLLKNHTKITCDPDTFCQFHPSKNVNDRKILSLAVDLYPTGEDLIVGICLRVSESNQIFSLGPINDPAPTVLRNYLKTVDAGIPEGVRKLIQINEAQYYLLLAHHR